MNCTQEELDHRNVFRLDVLLPLIKIIDVFMVLKEELSPDEFCIILLENERKKNLCELELNTVKKHFVGFEDFKALPIYMQNMIIELLMNIARYASFLEAVSRDILDKLRCRNYNDLHQTMVFLYILVYRISTLFFESSIDCFVHFKVKRIHFLVSYLLRSETPMLLHKKGSAIYEEDFVEQRIYLPYLEATPYLEKLEDHLREYMRNMKPIKTKATVPKFMNVLNRPKRNSIAPPPTPEDLAAMKFFREIPKSNYTKPLTEVKLEALRAANKLHAMNLLKTANANVPSCFQHSKGLIKSRKQEEPKVAFVKRKPVPTFKPVEVKPTAASTLRECARVVSDEEKEIKRLKELAEGGLDPCSILKLEEEDRQQKKEEELLKIQENRLSSLLAREGAFIAKQSLLNDVKSHAENVRKEKQELYEKLEKWRQDQNKEMAEIVEKCRETEQASREAFSAMIDGKRQKAAEILEESRQIKAQLIKQREDEAQRKMKLIQEIKAIQSLPSLPLKDFDPTESSGLGLLCEMSLTELKERLFWMKMKMNEEVEDRKAVIHQERKRQKNMIQDTRRALEHFKLYKRVTAPASKSQSSISSSISSPEVDALKKKLEERKAFRLQTLTVVQSK